MKEWHLLFEGLLTDAPGRCESWEERVRYLGSSRWRLCSIGTDFAGGTPGNVFSERIGTKRLIEWVNERDAEEPNSSAEPREDEASADSNTLGPRGTRLKQIAACENATLCTSYLARWERGEWPAAPPAPKIGDIVGVEKRAVWPRFSHAVYGATTSEGGAFVYPPHEDGTCRLVLKAGGSAQEGWIVRPSRRVLGQMANFKEAFERISE